MNNHSSSRRAEMAAALKASGLIAIIRGNFPFAQLIEIAEVLIDGGIEAVEITLNSAGALDAITELRGRYPDTIFVGAGTVRTAAQVDLAAAAGAQFLVSPNLDHPSVLRSQALDLLHLPGVFTATEAQTAFAAGCTLLKLFPADALGPAYLKALRAPLNDVDFVPTGGITPSNLGAYVQAGAAAVGIGSALVGDKDNTRESLQRRARAFRTAWDEASLNRSGA
jgi:2-dehydro-3-deoxyphosphogluconate aldolase/(4S)-4-hydroxy-2-oxoglutarate aldolase